MSPAELKEMLKNGEKRFKGLKLPGMDFRGWDLKNADFRGASLPGAVFTDADLTYANFEGANCYAVDFNNTKLHRTNFANANVSEASMMGVKDMYGVTVTMECKSFQRLRLDPGWWWGWLFYPLLMSPPKTATFDPERAKDALKLLMGADRWEVLRRQYANREM